MTDRIKLRAIASETVQILEAGYYDHPAVGLVDISSAIEKAKNGTILYEPGKPGSRPLFATNGRPQTSVENQTSLAAAKHLLETGANECVVLNFASALNPGGGFLNGAEAQEEFLARSSGLYACLLTQPKFYEVHKRQGSSLYTDHIIYSPDIPVIRDDHGFLLDQPYHVSMITAAAPNAGVIVKRAEREILVPTIMNRMDTLLSIAANHGHRNLVLGAWGCGAFKNDSRIVARAFKEYLQNDPAYDGAFDRVVFAVLDWSKDKKYIGPFEKEFLS